jgi:hypothetical protein
MRKSGRDCHNQPYTNRLVRHGIGPGQLPDHSENAPTTSLEASLRGLCALHVDASQADGCSDDPPKCDQGGSSIHFVPISSGSRPNHGEPRRTADSRQRHPAEQVSPDATAFNRAGIIVTTMTYENAEGPVTLPALAVAMALGSRFGPCGR